MKNLVIGIVGNESLHKKWISKTENCNYDLFLVYYGDKDFKKKQYKKESKYYEEKQGTKFNIVYELYLENKEIINKYKYIFVPDDDLLITPTEINRLFDISKKYNLFLSQPAIIGYYSVPITLAHPSSLLRYTNFVEIMCPCFEIETFKKLHESFNYNKSCWGIDILWDIELGRPKDKIAIIDDTVAIHTRPVYQGDYYQNNDIKEIPRKDIVEVCKKNNIKMPHEKIVYSSLPTETNWEQNNLFFPRTDKTIEACNKARGIFQ